MICDLESLWGGARPRRHPCSPDGQPALPGAGIVPRSLLHSSFRVCPRRRSRRPSIEVKPFVRAAATASYRYLVLSFRDAGADCRRGISDTLAWQTSNSSAWRAPSSVEIGERDGVESDVLSVFLAQGNDE